MEKWRSTRSCSRARTNSSSGYALVSAIVVAVLYFALIELMLIDASRELAEARRFRARIIALTLAESGAELAALDLVNRSSADDRTEDPQGTASWRMAKNAGGQFDIEAEAKTSGVPPVSAKVKVRGRVVNDNVRIQYTIHSQ